MKIKGIKLGTLKMNVFSMFLSNVCYAFYYWGQLSLISKYANAKMLGYYTLTLAIVLPLYKFSNMQLRPIIISDKKEDSSVDIGYYFSYRMMTTVFFLLSSLIIFLFIDLNPIMYFFFVGIKVVEGAADIINAKFQQVEKMHYVTMSVMLKSLLGLFGFVCGMFFLKDIFYAFLFSFLSNVIVFLFFDLKKLGSFNDFHFKYNKEVYKKVFITSFPLAITMLILTLTGSVATFYLEYFQGTEMQGIYSTIGYLVILGSFVVNAIGQAFVPRLSGYFLEDRFTEFVTLFKKYLYFNIILGGLGILISVVFGKFILKLLFSPEIAEYSDMFVWVMVYGLEVYILTTFGYTITAMRNFKSQPYINGLNFILTAVIGFFLIRHYGLYGAVISSIIVTFVTIIYASFIAKRTLNMSSAKRIKN